MKKSLIYLVFYSILFNCCVTYSPIFEADGEQNIPNPDETILIYLTDGSEIESKPKNHIYLDNPTNILLVRGRLIDESRGFVDSFTQWVLKDSADIIENDDVDDPLTTFKFKESDGYNKYSVDTAYFEQDSAIGFWVAGKLVNDEKETEFIGQIDLNKIEKIEEVFISKTKTIGIVVLAAFAVTKILLYPTDLELIPYRSGCYGKK